MGRFARTSAVEIGTWRVCGSQLENIVTPEWSGHYGGNALPHRFANRLYEFFLSS